MDDALSWIFWSVMLGMLATKLLRYHWACHRETIEELRKLREKDT
jgi:hypothetical protein